MVSGKREGIRIMVIAVLAACVAGCSFLKVTRYSQEKLPPTQSVEVFHKFPERAHVEIAKLSVRNNALRDEEGILIKEAEKLGADGIVFATDSAGAPLTDQVGIAIKWKGDK